jgi:hypothetical protein
MLAALLLVLSGGCGSCSNDDDGITIRIDDDDGFNGGNPLFNGLTCETADSYWSCSAPDGASLDFAIYYLTFRGIAQTTSATGSASTDTFSWRQPLPDRVELTTDDGERLVADDIEGSLAEKFLLVTLSGGGEPTRLYDCTLIDDAVLDRDCDEVIDHAPPTPTATTVPNPNPAS